PIIVRRAISDRTFATAGNIVVPSAAFGAVVSLSIACLGLAFKGGPYLALLMSIAVSTFLFCCYSPFWAITESALRVGDAYLVRSISVGLLYIIAAIASIIDKISVVYVGLVAVNIASGFAFWVIARNSLVEGGVSLGCSYLKEAAHIGA